MTPLILASSSVFRRQLLEQLHLPFQCFSPEVDETPLPQEMPAALALRLGRLKAETAAKHYPGYWLIGSDQVAVLDGKIYAKPGNLETAVKQLQQASGREMQFYTSLCLLNSADGQQFSDVVSTQVKFRPLDDTQIIRYLEKDTPFQCAGSFRAESLGISLFEYIRSDDPSALIGLPLIRLNDFLRQAGLDVLNAPELDELR